MTLLRRPLAFGTLVVLLVQVGGLIAAPVSACCRATPAASAACCKAAQQHPGPCPMHSRGGSANGQCRMTCDRHVDAPLLLGMFAPLPAPPSLFVPGFVHRVRPLQAAPFVSRISSPDTPPPEARA
jgi:hypothetical protein